LAVALARAQRVIVAFNLEVGDIELLEQRGGAVDAEAPRVLHPVPHCVAAFIVNDAPRATIGGRAVGLRWRSSVGRLLDGPARSRSWFVVSGLGHGIQRPTDNADYRTPFPSR